MKNMELTTEKDVCICLIIFNQTEKSQIEEDPAKIKSTPKSKNKGILLKYKFYQKNN